MDDNTQNSTEEKFILGAFIYLLNLESVTHETKEPNENENETVQSIEVEANEIQVQQRDQFVNSNLSPIMYEWSDCR